MNYEHHLHEKSVVAHGAEMLIGVYKIAFGFRVGIQEPDINYYDDVW